jgi:hypothetical protein
MIRFEPVPEPNGFDERARQPGVRWLAENPNAERPKDYWSAFKSELADGFRKLCAYSAMYEPVGTVDHFVSCNKDMSKAYEWSNYRYASAWLNSSKKNLSSEQVIDPFAVVDGWFEILLPTLQLVASDSVPDTERARVDTMLSRLHLGHDERIMRQRRQWYRLYQEGKLSIDGLAEMAPLIAAAVNKKQGYE